MQLQSSLWASTHSRGLWAGLAEAERGGKLGEPLLERDTALVQLKPLRPFTAGELCAMKALPAAAEDAAAAAAERRLDTGSSSGEPPDWMLMYP